MNPAIMRILKAKKKGGLHPLVKGLQAYLTTPAAGNDLRWLNDLITAWGDAGVLTKLEHLWIPRTFSEEASLVNIMNPGTADLVVVGSPSWAAYSGWIGGASGANNLHNNVAMNTMSKYLLNDCHMGVDIRTEHNGALRAVSAAGAAAPFALLMGRTSGHAQAWMNINGAPASGTVASSIGYTVGIRDASDNQEVWKDGVFVAANTATSSAVPAGSFYLCGYASGAGAVRVGLAHLGSALTDQEIADMNTAWQAYVTATS